MKVTRALFLLLPLACNAQTIQGRVENVTTGKPESERLVLLYNSSGELARTTTAADGSFQLEAGKSSDKLAHDILEVIQDGVEYFQPVHPGRAANVKVYNSSDRVNAISDHLSILQFQAKGNWLQVTELHAFSNTSNPPRTQVNSSNLVLALPPSARVHPAIVSGPDGGTAKIPLTPVSDRLGRYRIDFPIKPGLTKYAISYEVPYEGIFVFRRQAQYPIERLGIVVPESMRFRSLGGNLFHEVADGPGVRQQVLDGVAASAQFAFELAGTGGLVHAFHPSTPVERATSTATSALRRVPLASAPSPPTPAGGPPARNYLETHFLLALGIVAVAWILLRRTRFKRQARI